jgi:hypothetical protein
VGAAAAAKPPAVKSDGDLARKTFIPYREPAKKPADDDPQ